MANIVLQGWQSGANPSTWGWSGTPGIPSPQPVVKSIVDIGEDGVLMAITLSLFCDRRLKFDGIEPLTKDDRRGWWGDNTLAGGDLFGSRLWTLARYKFVDETIFPETIEIIKEALKWMLDDGVTKEINIDVGKQDRETMLIEISVLKPGEKDFTNYYFTWKLSDNIILI